MIRFFFFDWEMNTETLFIAAIIACALTLGDQCKHLLSQLTLRQCGGFEIPMNSKTDINLEEGCNFTNMWLRRNVIMRENMSWCVLNTFPVKMVDNLKEQ